MKLRMKSMAYNITQELSDLEEERIMTSRGRLSSA